MKGLILFALCGLWSAVSCAPLEAHTTSPDQIGGFPTEGPGTQTPEPGVRLQMMPDVKLPQPESPAPTQPEPNPELQTNPNQPLPPIQLRPVFPQTGFQPPVFPQAGFQPPVFPQAGFQPPVFPQTGSQPHVFPQAGFQPPVFPQAGFQPHVFPQTGPQPHVFPQTGPRQGSPIPLPGGQPLFLVFYPSMAGAQPQIHPEHFPQYSPHGGILVPVMFPGHPVPASPASQPAQPGNPGLPQQQQQQQQRPQIPHHVDAPLLVGTSGGLSSEELEVARMGAFEVQPPFASPAAQPLNPVMPVNPVMPLGPFMPPIMVSDLGFVPVEVPIPSHDILLAGLVKPQATGKLTSVQPPATNHQPSDANVGLATPPADVL